ncbi:accessory Sec system protein Asp2 [Staphylococcus xylosus]
MKRKFRALQIGGIDLEELFINDEKVEWDYFAPEVMKNEKNYLDIMRTIINENGQFDFVFIQTSYSEQLIEILEVVSTAYSTYIDYKYWNAQFENNSTVKALFVRPLAYQGEEDLHEKLEAVTFHGQYGDKLYPKHCIVNQSFEGEIKYMGNKYLALAGNFGETLKPVVSWKNNIVCDKHKATQIWPEFIVDESVEIEFILRIIQSGTVDKIIEEIYLNQNDLHDPIVIKSRPYDVYASVSLKIRGEGQVKIGAIHKRWSRYDMGAFLFGGQRYVDENREEFFHYFSPGDLQPPLNVYFSGYRSLEGFEGYFMMNKLDAPFILISDPRVEGGSFYIGSDSYETAIKNLIIEKLSYLGFNSDELILSGLSMGSFGALYYGAQLNPAAIIIGKPLVNIGTIADNMRLLRPEDFGTALDVLMTNEHDVTEQKIEHLNNKFWNVMLESDVADTTFAIAYMQHDDYDARAYAELFPVLSKQQARVISRGVPGRHNDDSPTIANWFINFYHILLETKFGRVQHDGK